MKTTHKLRQKAKQLGMTNRQAKRAKPMLRRLKVVGLTERSPE